MGSMTKASEIAAHLKLHPHPEGGFYSETFRDHQDKVDRPVSTAIYFLMPSGCVSHLHRIPMSETWHFYKGDPLTVVELTETGDVKQTILGSDMGAGQQLQYVVPQNVWFGSYPTMDIASSEGNALFIAPVRDSENHYSLVGCTCVPI